MTSTRLNSARWQWIRSTRTTGRAPPAWSPRGAGAVMAALLLALALAWPGCAADDSESSTPNLVLSLQSDARPQVGDTVTYAAVVSGSYTAVDTYSWLVTDSASKTLATGSARTISFAPAAAGDHTVRCQVTLEDGTGLSASATISVSDPSLPQVEYEVEILAPPRNGVPPALQTVTLSGNTPRRELAFDLDAGERVTIRVTDGSAPVPALVKVYRSGVADPSPMDLHLPAGELQARLRGSVDLLVIPLGGSLAPRLVSSQSTDTKQIDVKVDGGKLVSGVVKRSDGTPLAGATVALHTRGSGTVSIPSTVATTGADGSFQVRTSGGDASLNIIPPDSSGLPAATVSASTFKVLADESGWVFRYAAAAQPVTIQGKVTLSDGSTPAAGARVVVTSAASSAAVGTLKGLTWSLPASGTVRRELQTDSSGALLASGGVAPALPPGAYEAQLWPGQAAASTEGYASSTFELKSPGPAIVSLSLARRAKLSGTVLDPGGKGIRARIRASSTIGTFVQLSDSAGKFALAVDPVGAYQVVVRPSGQDSLNLAPYLLSGVTVTGDKNLAQLRLSSGVEISGRVTVGGSAIGDARVRITCRMGLCDTKLGLPTGETLDQTLTRQDGSFALVVPALDLPGGS